MAIRRRFKHRWVGITLNVLFSIFGVVILTLGIFLIYAAATTFHQKDVMPLEIKGGKSKTLKVNESVKMMIWNIGYCGLDETADFFMDGGSEVRAHSREQVQENMEAITAGINEVNPDICFIQEIDLDSDRTFRINELDYFNEKLGLDKYNYSFATNYKAGYVPYPLFNTIGKVNSGIVSYSKFEVSDAKRIQLPIPFAWPVRMFNLKRGLLVERMPIIGTDKELVAINLHLEAYSSEEGKVKQLKMLFDIINEEIDKGNYVIAGGDFNQRFSCIDSSMYPYYEGNWDTPIINTDDYTNVTFNMDNTHPTCRLLNMKYQGADKSTFQYYMIDGFICSMNVKVNNIHTLDKDFLNSDHNPVVMNFKLEA